MFILYLDDNAPEGLTDTGYSLMCGDGASRYAGALHQIHCGLYMFSFLRWCDKTFGLAVYANGNTGIHCEHRFFLLRYTLPAGSRRCLDPGIGLSCGPAALLAYLATNIAGQMPL